MSQRGRPSLASAAAVNQVYAQASGFAPPGGMTSPPNVFSPRTTAGPTAATVQQPRTRSRAAAYYDYGDDDDFRYNETGATASSAGRWPTFSLGSVILCALFAFFLALGTNFRILTVGATDADARALASRVKSVSESIDAVAKALAADAKRRPASSGASASGRDVSALRSDLAKMQKQPGAGRRPEGSSNSSPPPPRLRPRPCRPELSRGRQGVRAARPRWHPRRRRARTAAGGGAAAGETEALRRDRTRARGGPPCRAFRVADREAERTRTEEDGRRRGRPVVSMDPRLGEVRLQMQTLSATHGPVDSRAYSGGGRPGHSQLSPPSRARTARRPRRRRDAGRRTARARRVLSGGSETPGECLALGADAWVDVRPARRRSSRHPRAHSYIAHDITSAPKTAVLGWNRTKTPSDGRWWISAR